MGHAKDAQTEILVDKLPAVRYFKVERSSAIVYRFMAFSAALALAAGFSGARLRAQTAQDDAIATSSGNAIIHPISHASVLVTWNNQKILVDPAPPMGGGGGRAPGAAADAGAGRGAEAGGGGRAEAGGAGRGAGGGAGGGRGAGGPGPAPSPEVIASYKALGAPDLILVTHPHGDHFNAQLLAAIAGPNTVLGAPQAVYDGLPDALKAKATIMANGDTSTLAGISVHAVPAYNITPALLRNHPQGVGNGYVVNLGGKLFYFAGDTEAAPELLHLANIDVAFIPMNAPTETEEAAAEWVKQFKPKIVYPYHYSNADLAVFVQAVGNASEVRLRKWY
jgi:L-ascorbate metabolism protein UlaG (beta-lactamase superfamily)